MPAEPVAHFGLSCSRTHARTRFCGKLRGLTILLLSLGLVPTARCAEGEEPASRLEFTVSVNSLRAAIERTALAMGDKTTRFELDGVLIEATSVALTFVATDGRRLCTVELPATGPKPGGAAISTFLPKEFAPAILVSLRAATGDCKVSVAPREFALEVGGAATRLPTREPRYPRWKESVGRPAGGAHVASASDNLLTALERVGPPLSAPRGHVTLTFEEGRLLLAASPAPPQATPSSIRVDYTGKPTTIHVDHRYLIPFLRKFESPEMVTIHFRGSTEAIEFSTEDRCRYVVMPIAVD